MPKPYLEWIDENQQIQRLEIVDKIFIGRGCEGVEPQKRILLDNTLVSRDHAVISRRKKGLKITDTSKNGTWVNDVRLAAGSSRNLADGDIIRLGETSFHVAYPEDVTVVKEDDRVIERTIVTPTEVIVTNLVADVRGFTSFSEAHSSTDAYALMKEIYDKFSAIVFEYRGTIKDYAGDAVYAFWDHHVEPLKEQAVLACQAAIRQTQAMNEIKANLADKNIAIDKLQMGWGISTGEVTMSHYESRAVDLALVGDCINLAFRLSGMANKDLSEQIVICSQTAELVVNDLQVKDLGVVSIRGRKGKEHIFSLKDFQ